ncbi:MAG TPA: hypothetical protein DCP73_14720 [Chloroflexi bacterium]|nr:hypothetical protein [Chloroflexota bacterium]
MTYRLTTTLTSAITKPFWITDWPMIISITPLLDGDTPPLLMSQSESTTQPAVLRLRTNMLP